MGHYNDVLEKTSIYDLPTEELQEMVNHYAQLDLNINVFTANNVFLPVSDCVRNVWAQMPVWKNKPQDT